MTTFEDEDLAGIELAGPASSLEDDEATNAPFGEARPLELFDGDVGSLGIDQRLCLIALLKHTFISANQHTAHWQTLSTDEVLIKGRLNDLLLDLVIDHDREVAYKVQIRDADGVSTVPPLLRAATYTREETVLMVFLRGRYTSDRADGQEQVFVERDELLAHVEQLRPEHATDIAGDRRRAEQAITALVRAGILQGRQDAATFRVSPVIETLLPVSQLKALARWFSEQSEREPSDEGDEPSDQAEEPSDG